AARCDVRRVHDGADLVVRLMAPDAGERLDGGVSETGPEVVVHGRAVGGRPWRRCSDDLDVQLRVDLLGLDTGLPRDGVEVGDLLPAIGHGAPSGPEPGPPLRLLGLLPARVHLLDRG